MRFRSTFSVVCLAAAGLAFTAAPAGAAPGDAVAEGSAGGVTIGEATVGPIASCSTEGPSSGESGEVAVPNVATYSSGTSTCTIDEAGEIAKTTVTGGRFRFDALLPHGGPRLRLSDYTATCETTLTGSNSSIRFSGLHGVTVPSELPSNHVVTIPGDLDGKPLATVTFNEAVTPSPPDGSMTVHLMHIRMFPEGGPTPGDAYVGTVRCAPVP
ncbi:hypothetical protein [Actinophytocola glycyrrhizae]|uniref:Neocarzinostatin family protein n=1 Tax=Actinophytocola glycyrrhizae TaxID=2044873 RepID=A0ABV9SDM7_9PSEU